MQRALSVSLRTVTVLLLVVLLGALGYSLLRWKNAGTPEGLLHQADDMAWLNNWIGAEPLYCQAELLFTHKHQLAKALYARVSEMPAHSESSISVPTQIAILTHDLSLPESYNAETRLRILTILGMLEVNYDSGMARATWSQVEALALRRHEYRLASRAIGEQGIAAFLLGDLGTAKKNVIKAWTVAKVADPAARVRYASVYGAGLVELHKFNEALGPLNEAIKVANNTPGVAYPTIAINTKIEALSGLGKHREALALASEALQRASNYHLAGHLFEVYQTRAGVYQNMGQWDLAASDFDRAVQYAKQLSYWRGLTQVDGSLAKMYLHQGALPSALNAINEAIEANERIPEELYFVPRNLAIKAEITARMGNLKASNDLYEKSADVIDALLRKVPTPTIERLLLAQLSEVYSGYFASLGDQGRDADAFHVIERARGRVEAEHLANHQIVMPHEASLAEQRVTNLNLALLNTDNAAARTHILESIYESEQELDPGSMADAPPAHPVDLAQLQKDLSPSELFIEYVLSEPQSYALAVTHDSVRRYPLPPKGVLEQQATEYRYKIVHQKTDLSLAQQLFDGLLKGIPEYKQKQKIVVVPDGKLHLLSFPALVNDGKYILISHRVTIVPSGTVLHLLRRRPTLTNEETLPYIGVAAWTTNAPSKTFLASILRAVSGPKRSELVALPESQHEVEAIAADLPKPSTILLGALATKTAFKQLPLSQYRVIHLALHGYADAEYPDRSALVFAPQLQAADDGLLQVREIRNLTLNANLVTLSACDTGVGPVGEAGVANIVNAFIEAGAMSVVSTLWELEDHATAHLMTAFYEHLSRHEEKADALREAQLEMLHSGSVPYYWAGFMLSGEPDGSLFNETEVDVPPRSSR